MPLRPRFCYVVVALCLLLLPLLSFPAPQQEMSALDRGRLEVILREAHDDVEKNYYDPTLHGIDWDERYQKYCEKLKQINHLSLGFSLVSEFLDGLNDSHTFFIPPEWPIRHDYGFRLLIVGDKLFVLQVRPGTDAETKLHPGDEIISYNGFKLDRGSFFRTTNFFNRISPRKDVTLVLKDADGQLREVKVLATIKELSQLKDRHDANQNWHMRLEQENALHLLRPRYAQLGDNMGRTLSCD